MSFVGTNDPGVTVVIIHLEKWRDFVPILLVLSQVILSDVFRILADNQQQFKRFHSVMLIKSVGMS